MHGTLIYFLCHLLYFLLSTLAGPILVYIKVTQTGGTPFIISSVASVKMNDREIGLNVLQVRLYIKANSF